MGDIADALLRARVAAQSEPLLRWFVSAHLPPDLRAVSAPFGQLAETLVATLAPSAERTVALRKLLEGKDAAVRARLLETTPTGSN